MITSLDLGLEAFEPQLQCGGEDMQGLIERALDVVGATIKDDHVLGVDSVVENETKVFVTRAG